MAKQNLPLLNRQYQGNWHWRTENISVQRSVRTILRERTINLNKQMKNKCIPLKYFCIWRAALNVEMNKSLEFIGGNIFNLSHCIQVSETFWIVCNSPSYRTGICCLSSRLDVQFLLNVTGVTNHKRENQICLLYYIRIVNWIFYSPCLAVHWKWLHYL